MESLQQDINKSMRGILIDWLVEVSFDCTEYIAALQAQHTPAWNNLVITYLCIIHLVQVAEEYKLVPDTLYYTISYIDRFLSTNVVPRQRLQLLGVSCMLIAA
jgi:cyclin A